MTVYKIMFNLQKYLKLNKNLGILLGKITIKIYL